MKTETHLILPSLLAVPGQYGRCSCALTFSCLMHTCRMAAQYHGAGKQSVRNERQGTIERRGVQPTTGLTYLSSTKELIAYKEKLQSLKTKTTTTTFPCRKQVSVSISVKTSNDTMVITDILPQTVSLKTIIKVEF